ncbi:MAG: hypothetical protein WCA77_06955 [Thermoplasmata archaeon]
MTALSGDGVGVTGKGYRGGGFMALPPERLGDRTGSCSRCHVQPVVRFSDDREIPSLGFAWTP